MDNQVNLPPGSVIGMLILTTIQSYHHLARNCHPFLTVLWMMNIFISLQRLLVRRTNLLGTTSNTSLEVTQPVPLPVLDPTQLLSLNCFVLGDDLKKAFHQQNRKNTVMGCDKLQFNAMGTILYNRCRYHHNAIRGLMIAGSVIKSNFNPTISYHQYCNLQ